MAKEYAKRFYSSKSWQQCRDGYKESVMGLCERCMSNGILEEGEIVHHKIHITPDNISDANITLNWDNLELLCRSCHENAHRNKSNKRYRVNNNGDLIF